MKSPTPPANYKPNVDPLLPEFEHSIKALLAMSLVSVLTTLGILSPSLEAILNCLASQFIIFLTEVNPKSWAHFFPYLFA